MSDKKMEEKTFEDYWKGLCKSNGGEVTKTVKMTPAQFKKMQEQAFDYGKKQGQASVANIFGGNVDKFVKDLGDKTKQASDNREDSLKDLCKDISEINGKINGVSEN